MARNPAPSSATAQNVASLIPKLYENDPDLRYMGLNDLQQVLLIGPPTLLLHDVLVSAKAVDGLMSTLQDKNGEVQNMAVKCLGPFVNKISPDQILCPLIDKISNLHISDAVDDSVPALALRQIVINLPRPTSGLARSKPAQDAYSAISRALIPRLVGHIVMPSQRKDLPKAPKGLMQDDMDRGTDSNAIDVLTEVAKCYGPMLQEPEVNALVKVCLEVLRHERTSSVFKKKALTAIAALSPHLPDTALSQFTSRVIELLKGAHLTKSKRKLYINLLGSLARAIPKRFGKYLQMIAPFVFTALSQQEIDDDLSLLEETEERDPEVDDVREAALIALESFLSCCPEDMRLYTNESLEVILRFLKYDPNLADDEDDTMAEEHDDDDAFGGSDDDFEEEAGIDDEDDTSWKVRRCAAKAADSFVATRSGGDARDGDALFTHVAPALVARFKEREESVRVEIISALAHLVRATGGIIHQSMVAEPISSVALPSRKRRRGSSNVGVIETQVFIDLHPVKASTPLPGSNKARLEALSPDIVRGVAQVLKTQQLPTKQASISLMKDLAEGLGGRLADFINQTIDPVVEAVQFSGSESAASGSHVASVNTYRIEALQYLKAVGTSHTSATLQPYLPKIVPAITKATKDKYTKIAVSALEASDAFVKALTLPGSKPDANAAGCIKQFYDATMDRVSASDSDTEVRRLAIRCLGTLLGRASRAPVLSSTDKNAGYELLSSKLKNELTRLSSVRAIETVASLVLDASDYPMGFVPTICIELAAQLRKASRVLRSSSLQALKTLSVNSSAAQIDAKTMKELETLLLPVLHLGDLQMLSPALLILSAYVQQDPKTAVNKDFNDAFGKMLASTDISGTALDNLLLLTRTVGEKGVGKPLMEKLLAEVSLKASPDLVGKVVGNLLVSGGNTTGFKLQQFVGEAQGKSDGTRKCLALSIMGEAAFRLGQSSPLEPQLFIDFFGTSIDKVPLAAAIALGRAAAGNLPLYLPTILRAMGQPTANQYLLLHSVREILIQEDTDSHISPFAAQLWNNLLAASQADDNRAIGAECIGRLAVLEPATYLPQLQIFLGDKSATVRGMVISALRFTFGDTDESYDSNLEPIIIGMLQTMLGETDLENQRLALTTLTSAAQHKPNLIVPHLGELLPLCIRETEIRPELIREVQMGPFKHKVDDGLEIRKSAYETIYSLLDMSFSLLDTPTLFSRIIAGLTDDHDIRDYSTLILNRLIVLAPQEISPCLDHFVDPFRQILATKPKDNAVKQEVDRIQDEQKHVIKVSVTLAKQFPDESADVGRSWGAFWEGHAKKDFSPLVKIVEDELREKER